MFYFHQIDISSSILIVVSELDCTRLLLVEEDTACLDRVQTEAVGGDSGLRWRLSGAAGV